MDATSIASRRSVLKGLGTIAALVAASAPVSAKPVFARIASPTSPAGAVTAAIAQHKAVMRDISRLHRATDKLETLPGRPKTPRVHVGNFVHQNGGERTRSPIVAYSHSEISERCEASANPACLTDRQRAAIRAQFRGYHLDLTRQIRALAKFDRASGLTSLREAVMDAYHREAEAEAMLLLALPATAKEAAAKASYIKRSALLREWTECPVAYRAVMRGLCAVGGRA